MTRFKTFVADGTAPNGRLYAGDLNSIQDRYADLSNFSQVIGVGTLQVGDTTLMLVKYGTGEIRVTAALRTDGIVRALGGIFAGTFTTAQRDAIPAGSRPYGLIILNTTNNGFEWNQGTDAAPSWGSLSGNLANMPSTGEKQALAGNAGAPSSSNKYVTEQGLATAVGGAVIDGDAAGGDLGGTYPNPTVLRASGAFSLPGDISPAALTADQNDFAPTGLTTASVLRVSGTAARKITGLTGGADGRLLIIENVGNFPVTLGHENTLSSAVNRFSLPNNADAILGLGEMNIMLYDVTLNRWRVAARSAPTVFVGCIVYCTANTPVASADGLKAVPMGGEDMDTSGFHTGSSSQLVIPTGLDGMYEVVFYQACSSGGGIGSAIKKNGTDILAFDSGNNTQSPPTGVPASVGLPHCPFVQLVAGDYVEGFVMTSSSTSALARVGNNRTSGCWMSLHKIG